MADFLWGNGGTRLTPEDVAAQRKYAQGLMSQGMDYSPVASPWQGAARVAQALLGGYEGGQADYASKQNADESSKVLAALLGGAGGAPAAAAPATAAPVSAAPAAIPADKGGFVSSIMPAALDASAKTGVDPRIIVAQAAIESGWGQHAPGNNLFGIKSHGQAGGNVLPTTEVVNGQPVRTSDSFRSYASPTDSVGGYADFINTNPRYAALKSAQGVDAQAAALGASGYATDPTYGAKVASIARGLPDPGATVAPPAQPAGPMVADSDPAALPPNATPTQGFAIPGQPAQPGAQPTPAPAAPARPAVNPAIVAAMTNRYIDPQTKAIASMLFQKDMDANKVTQVDLGNKVMLMDSRGNPVRTIDKGEPNKGPEYGVIGKDQFGNEQYGWRDPRTQNVTPYNPQSGQPAQPSSIPPAPPGVDPKVWREAQSKAASANALPGTFDDTYKLRSEFTSLPAYKNMAQAAPVYQSMRDAAGRDTKAADLNIVYGLGKIMDPGSVVREGEIQMANNAQGWQEKLNGIIGQINSKGGLTPQGREALMAEAHGRIMAYKAEFDRDAGRYKGISERNRINAADVIPDFGTIEPWMAPKDSAPGAVAPGAPPTAGAQKTKTGITWSIQ